MSGKRDVQGANQMDIDLGHKPFVFLFPYEIQLLLLTFLDVVDLLLLSRTCKYFHALCNDEYLWGPLYYRYYRDVPKKKIIGIPGRIKEKTIKRFRCVSLFRCIIERPHEFPGNFLKRAVPLILNERSFQYSLDRAIKSSGAVDSKDLSCKIFHVAILYNEEYLDWNQFKTWCGEMFMQLDGLGIDIYSLGYRKSRGERLILNMTQLDFWKIILDHLKTRLGQNIEWHESWKKMELDHEQFLKRKQEREEERKKRRAISRIDGQT